MLNLLLLRPGLRRSRRNSTPLLGSHNFWLGHVGVALKPLPQVVLVPDVSLPISPGARNGYRWGIARLPPLVKRIHLRIPTVFHRNYLILLPRIEIDAPNKHNVGAHAPVRPAAFQTHEATHVVGLIRSWNRLYDGGPPRLLLGTIRTGHVGWLAHEPLEALLQKNLWVLHVA